MSNLRDLLLTKQKDSKLSIEDQAKAIGVSVASLRGILTGKSSPNLRTKRKYAAYLGVEESAIAGDGGGAPKGRRRSSRRSVKRTASRAVKASGRTGGLSAALGTLAALVGDSLAQSVHAAPAAKRAVIAAIIKA